MIRKKILNNIENDYNSEKELIKKLDITKCKLEETIEQLEKKGYIINKTEKGYKLKDTPDILEPFEIKRKLETEIIGKTIHFYKEVKSTNTIATDFLKNGAEDGTIIVAESQKAGKSRKGREWVSPKGGLWLTMILRPKIEIEYAPRLTLVAGVAVAKSLRENFGLDATIKWPNDILINSRKICGILTEAIIEDDTLEGVLVGVGIDINNDKSSLPEHLQSQTTTMSEELNEEISRAVVVQSFFKTFEDLYLEFQKGNFGLIVNEWRKLSSTIGNRVKVYTGKRAIYADAVGIDKEGALIVECRNGNLQRIVSGECIIQKPTR